jgi:cellulose synthase operon protein C
MSRLNKTIKNLLASGVIVSYQLASAAQADENSFSQDLHSMVSDVVDDSNLPVVALLLDQDKIKLGLPQIATDIDSMTGTHLNVDHYLDMSNQLGDIPAPAETEKIASFALVSRAEEEIASIEGRRNPRVEMGFEIRDKNSTDGTSSYHGKEVPMIGWWPVGYEGHAFAQVDYVSIDAGDLPNNENAYLFGKLGAKRFIPASPISQRANGTSLAGGYVGDGLRWDVGVIGLGFPVQNFVGGIRKSWEVGKVDYALELSRRAQTSSLLSYAGARDPATGEIWGGVTNTTLSGRTARYFDQVYTFASAEYGLLQGENVLNNNRLALRIGMDKDFIHQEDMQLNLGLTLSYWRFKENESNYTFGHGGYYSPQNYTSISLPVEWVGRKNKLSYSARASVSYSQSNEKDMNYYPTDQALQDNSAPGHSVYAGGSGNGFGYALRLTTEYLATPHLAIGGRLEVERSNYYEPNTLFVYFKYALQPQREPVSFPPAVVKPLSQF